MDEEQGSHDQGQIQPKRASLPLKELEQKVMQQQDQLYDLQALFQGIGALIEGDDEVSVAMIRLARIGEALSLSIAHELDVACAGGIRG